MLPDGGNRIQCISYKTDSLPILIVSVSMPTKGKGHSLQEYQDCVDQIGDIISKYVDSHNIVIGGDFNESLEEI